jgi:hypothetical protein
VAKFDEKDEVLKWWHEVKDPLSPFFVELR